MQFTKNVLQHDPVEVAEEVCAPMHAWYSPMHAGNAMPGPPPPVPFALLPVRPSHSVLHLQMDALAGQFKNLTRTTLHAVKQLDPNTKATRRRRGYYGHY